MRLPCTIRAILSIPKQEGPFERLITVQAEGEANGFELVVNGEYQLPIVISPRHLNLNYSELRSGATTVSFNVRLRDRRSIDLRQLSCSATSGVLKDLTIRPIDSSTALIQATFALPSSKHIEVLTEFLAMSTSNGTLKTQVPIEIRIVGRTTLQPSFLRMQPSQAGSSGHLLLLGDKDMRRLLKENGLRTVLSAQDGSETVGEISVTIESTKDHVSLLRVTADREVFKDPNAIYKMRVTDSAGTAGQSHLILREIRRECFRGPHYSILP